MGFEVWRSLEEAGEYTVCCPVIGHNEDPSRPGQQ